MEFLIARKIHESFALRNSAINGEIYVNGNVRDFILAWNVASEKKIRHDIRKEFFHGQKKGKRGNSPVLLVRDILVNLSWFSRMRIYFSWPLEFPNKCVKANEYVGNQTRLDRPRDRFSFSHLRGGNRGTNVARADLSSPVSFRYILAGERSWNRDDEIHSIETQTVSPRSHFKPATTERARICSWLDDATTSLKARLKG